MVVLIPVYEQLFGAPRIDLPGVQPLADIEKTREVYFWEREIYLGKIQEKAAKVAFMDIVEKAHLPEPIVEADAEDKVTMKCPIHNTPVGCYVQDQCDCYAARVYEYAFEAIDTVTDALHAGLKVFIKAWIDAGGHQYPLGRLPHVPNDGERPDWNYMEYFYDQPEAEAAGAPGNIVH